MSAAQLKAQGNAHFAAKEWSKAVESYTAALKAEQDTSLKAPLYSNRSAAFVHLDRLEEALADANACIDAKPEWSKAYARLGEARSRLQLFDGAVMAYERAIERAEDSGARERYTTALKTAKATSERNERAYANMSGKNSVMQQFERTAVHKLSVASNRGLRIDPGGSLALLGFAYNQGQKGFLMLDEYVDKVNGQNVGQAGTNTNQELSECLLLDQNAFIIPPGTDPEFPLIRKLSALQQLDYFGMGLLKYYESKATSAKEIVADLNRRLPKEDWLAIRRSSSVLIRGNVLQAWICSKNKAYGEALQCIETALEVLEEGNKIWKDVDFDDKGNSFRPTMIRIIRAFQMELQLEASRDAFSTSARKVFKLETVEATAQKILSENPQSQWPTAKDLTRLAYYVLPTARAYLALGYASSQRAGVDLVESRIPSGKAALAKLDDAKKAARYYDLAAKFLPNDDVRKPQTLFMALQQHLRAGGKKPSEVFKMYEEAERLRADLSRFYEELGERAKYPPREFVQFQVQAVKDWLASPGAQPYQGVPPLEQKIKPIPTLNLQGTPPSFNPNSVLNARFWLALPGEIGLVDVLGMRPGLRGDYA